MTARNVVQGLSTPVQSTGPAPPLPDAGVPGQAGYANYANFPVNYVSWGDAARFCNWLQNNQPTGVEGPAS